MQDADKIAAYLEKHLQAAEEQFRTQPTGDRGVYAYGWLSGAVRTAIESLREAA